MKLYYHRNRNGLNNFGDDLNPWLWGRTLAAELDDDQEPMFLGIGTLLNDRLPPAASRVVFGTGTGIGGAAVLDSSWKFYAVRGPLTARSLGLPANLAITDPAILVSHFAPPRSDSVRFTFSYMPHYRNACKSWKNVCNRIGFGYIDPRGTVDEVLQAMLDTKVLLAEAMHGAIIADTLRVPWVPIRSRDKILRFKWEDWCSTMGVMYQPQSTVALWDGDSLAHRMRGAMKQATASLQLLRAARRDPTLSSDAIFLRNRERYDELLDTFRRDIRDGHYRRRDTRRTAVSVQTATLIQTEN